MLKIKSSVYLDRYFLYSITFKRWKSSKYSKYYKLLEVADNADQETVRLAFINLCKLYHPDSGDPNASHEKFQEIEAAYRCLQNKFAEDRWNVNEGVGEYGLYYKEQKNKTEEEEVQIFDIKHTAPQHRQYLSYDGVGSGTPSQREKQYRKYRASVAVDNVYNNRVDKLYTEGASQNQALVVADKKQARNIKTRYGVDRLVEDLIQESISRGVFDNLSGQGKPLQQRHDYNPYVDFVTHKMNQILIDNGFQPEWITLRKDINQLVQNVKDILTKERKRLGKHPLSPEESDKWSLSLQKLKADVAVINSKINQLNLIVPLLKQQMFCFSLEKEAQNILERGEYKDDSEPATDTDVHTNTNTQQADDFILSKIMTYFFKS